MNQDWVLAEFRKESIRAGTPTAFDDNGKNINWLFPCPYTIYHLWKNRINGGKKLIALHFNGNSSLYSVSFDNDNKITGLYDIGYGGCYDQKNLLSQGMKRKILALKSQLI